MTIEPTYEELKKQNAELKKQIEILQIDFVKITDKRKQAEIDNEKANIRINQLGTALDNLDTYVYIKDNQSRYLYANQKTLKLFNCTAKELYGSTDSSFFPQETCEQLAQIDKRILELGENTALEVESKDSDGNRLVYWEIKTPIFDKNDKSKIVGLCGISTEITERKKTEQLLIESNATKDKFFSIIAHDLRSPFNNILGYTELVIENTKKIEVAEYEKYFGIINSSAKKTLVLLDNLLNWAKSQTGQISFNPEKQVFSSIIQEIFKLSNSSAKNKNIILNFFESERIVVLADPNMFKTILRNLISNAIKFTNPNGKIDVYALQNDKFIEIAVSDNGVGMDEETQNKLFRLESNKSTLGTANEKGTGLGLLLCKEFVEKHGGEIWVESKLGKGSVFKFKLPLKN